MISSRTSRRSTRTTLKPQAPVVKDGPIARRTGYLQRYNTRDVGVQLIDLGGRPPRTTSGGCIDLIRGSFSGFSDIVLRHEGFTKGDTSSPRSTPLMKLRRTRPSRCSADILHIDDPEPPVRPR